MKAKEYLAPAVVLTLICAVISFLLGLTNEATKDRIAENEIKAANAARIEVLPGAQDFEDVTFFIDNPDYEGYSLYRETSGLGYAVTTKAKGYGGDITVVTGISAEGKVTGVYTLNSSETPGLGKKTEDEAFTEQYLADRQGSQFQVVKNTAKGPGEVVAVAGATISSKAVTQAVNQAVEIYALYAYSRDTM
ncbi:MAG: RnfABCDGE type electron transport complex subunit G [Oscillospiraceae bacterium]|jgi:electron transport complex protein RnfG|nr:RnfABCDGE type electron transport complex subunit G [Oscillospiraceae bacterium]